LLEQRFAQIDATLVKEKLAQARADKDKLTPTLRKNVFRKELPGEIVRLFQKWAA
jgi:hypothetical protein